jgi:hypothetical protein
MSVDDPSSHPGLGRWPGHQVYESSLQVLQGPAWGTPVNMYIGLGTVVLILVILLIIYLVRRA